MLPPPPRSPFFPYTTLFRSRNGDDHSKVVGASTGRRESASGARLRFTERRQDPLCNLMWLNAIHVHHQIRRFVGADPVVEDRKSTRLNSSHANISYAVFCLK